MQKQILMINQASNYNQKNFNKVSRKFNIDLHRPKLAKNTISSNLLFSHEDQIEEVTESMNTPLDNRFLQKRNEQTLYNQGSPAGAYTMQNKYELPASDFNIRNIQL